MSDTKLIEQQLLAAISGSADGLGVEALLPALAPLPRRTLQRWLARLVKQQRLRIVGIGRAVRYRVLSPPATPHAEPARATESRVETERYIPLSTEGAEIKAAIRAPRAARKPVSYEQAFLEDYHPNHSAYLAPDLRAQLHAMGRAASAQAEAPAGTFARDILNRLLIDLAWASSQLEGNTYSQLDTERLIELGEAAEGKDALETQMILNHKEAIHYLVRDPAEASLTRETLIALHALLSDGLMADPLTCGRLRTRIVEIGGSVYRPIGLPQRIAMLFDYVVSTAAEIDDPFEQAFFLMVHVPYLQPFEDVNKRVSRLAANIPLIRHNLCPLSFIDVPTQAYVDGLLGVYELNRVELLRDVFVWAYERSCQQYLAVQQQLVPPEPFRLRYRQALGETVARMVRNRAPANEASIAQHLPTSVLPSDHARFVQLVLREFNSLHEGNVVRFGLRPLEWREYLHPA